MYDRHVWHDEYLNTYSFIKDEHKVTLRPMHPEELVKRHKHVQVELMMRSGVVDHIGNDKTVLIAVSKQKF